MLTPKFDFFLIIKATHAHWRNWEVLQRKTVKITHNPLPAREQQVLLFVFLAGLFKMYILSKINIMLCNTSRFISLY